MGKTLAYKILENHLVSGNLTPGEEITIKIDQTLTQDSTGTMVYLQLEAMDVDKVQTELSVAYIDHNTLQTGFENADDHAFIKSVAQRHGVLFSKPGNGICHQLHLENYGKPGKTLLGSDSHTPTGGGLGMIAIGAGGLDVAVAMAKGTYSLVAPKVIKVELKGRLHPWTSAKDVILYVLQQLSVKGGVGKIVEYTGEGVKSLSVTDRATITNMGAELGATTSVFPSDENTKAYLKSQGREADYTPLAADADAVYDQELIVDLDSLTPLAAQPHSPDNVDSIANIGEIKVDQVAIGSCTNSSYTDLMKVAAILKGKKVHPDVSLVISPGSSKILTKMAENGALADIIASGARIIENACGPCIGMGQSPKSGAVSLRTFNRNFKGRSGTLDADVYLVSPETAAISAVTGVLTDGSKTGQALPQIEDTDFTANDNFIVYPEGTNTENTPVAMGPNIKPFPRNTALPETVEVTVTLHAGDNITTDDIMPSDSRLLPYRSNIPHLANYCFEKVDSGFAGRCKEAGTCAIIGGDNYGQGSSREHAALAPLYLGVKFVVAKSFARIHRSNLINSGIMPLVFENPADYDDFTIGDELVIEQAPKQVQSGTVEVKNKNTGKTYQTKTNFSDLEIALILKGGKINYMKG
ncbi:aconitate hydratase [Ihubacter massiliensis]|uniref:Aconitate hydratase n=1 Tax=Hominibacterium faecale TaxID=2839743 RepID=A0A9J6QXW1_9FIRM|nr:MULTISPECIES: aconitate hydratase [Eubacteriales Family XIII. Incertae Sedis]MCO7123659.1 aconitate hydratase [Ihubacter massiliensis]MCU7380314.1 aconitate hydratase [Hominibacterium faecale]